MCVLWKAVVDMELKGFSAGLKGRIYWKVGTECKLLSCPPCLSSDSSHAHLWEGFTRIYFSLGFACMSFAPGAISIPSSPRNSGERETKTPQSLEKPGLCCMLVPAVWRHGHWEPLFGGGTRVGCESCIKHHAEVDRCLCLGVN